MLSITFETSESSDHRNWVKNEILKSGLDLLSFEGYTIKNSTVSLLLDRGCFSIDCANINALVLFNTLLSNNSFHLKSKVDFAEKLNCKYVFFCYSYINENCCIYLLTSDNATLLESFSTLKEFAEWSNKFRDLVMTSNYEGDDLPILDRRLRKLGIPWPGNLDYALLKDHIPVALIEFQTTYKLTVAKHCNNDYFLPSPYRKGDVNRWLAIDIIRKQSKLPLLVIVWSPNESCIKLKVVDKIVYPSNEETPKGLMYLSKDLMDINRLLVSLNSY